ncbi:hypothetical protein MM35RIKEN_22270 (plasmid) [Vescimonas fastidiosa]|uniref:Gram-positive cocci surface proteins LPxTG domain-containing protein n=1 Tax=Vescimonas fastidiosa TaxID=2714353 RepID=A0A810Q0R5_9FIRM|nr:pectate lyase-like adhesive domain-containing protein [Vescimonas fastidiosa]BCK80035.1 hypothetical protein MM35RIKEN_22270 [Vescimonas fastidiosa]
MKKRILSILLTLCMLFCLVPTSVFAEGETFKNVANAAELKSALADDSVPGIRLTSNIVTGEAFSVTRTVTLDLNGYMLKMTGNDSVIRVEKKNQKIGDLTLIDSRPTTQHRFKADDKNGRWQLDENGDMLVNGGIITSTGTEQRSGGGGVAVSADTKFTMTGGNIVGCDSDKLGSGVYVSFGTFTMTGGRIVGCGNDPGIYLEVWAIMNANGGEVDATVALRENSKITTRDDLAGVTVFRKKVNVFDADSYGVVKYGLFYVPPSNGTTREIVYLANGAPYAVQIMSSESLNLAVEPEIPTSNTGSTFLGWYKADGTKWDFTRDVVNDHICVAARWDTAQQFSGVEVGKTYYFDLSDESIPGTVNANLPDTTLHYVPFTYVGTLDGYVLKPASGGVLDSSDKAANTADSSAPYGHAYRHSLFMADHILTTDVSYDTLSASDFIFGNSCTVNDVDYTLRAPTIGNTYAFSASQGIPENNEWDQILFKDSGFIKNLLLATPSWSEIWAWGQDTNTSGSIIRSVRSGRNQLGGAPTRFDTHVGYRPVLELPTDLAADSLKTVALALGGGKLGGSSEDIQIIVKNGSAFTAPASGGLTRPAGNTGRYFMWLGSDGNLYAPGGSVPALVTTLTAQWKDTEKPTGEIIIGANKWQEFLNKLTFGLFFKDTQTVTINAADNSGTVFVSYLVTDRDLSEEELKSLVFSGYEEPFGIDPNGEHIVYAMLVDESLNITYLRSDRVTLDNVRPVISGIEAGKTYCEAQTVTVEEKYVDTVTVNGTAVTLDENGSFTLAPADGEQKIVVTDKAGNTAEMTVTVNDGHTGGKATCTEKAVCEVCGKAYGELDPKNHTDLKHIPAKAATEDAEGNIEYWYCKGCGKYYSDKDGTKEIAKADTVTAKLPKSPPTGDTSSLSSWLVLMLAGGGAATGAAALSRKKKHDR